MRDCGRVRSSNSRRRIFAGNVVILLIYIEINLFAGDYFADYNVKMCNDLIMTDQLILSLNLLISTAASNEPNNVGNIMQQC